MTHPAPARVESAAPEAFPSLSPRVEKLAGDAEAARGTSPINDAIWRDLNAPSRDSAGFLVDDDAYAHVARSDNAVPAHWELGLVVAGRADAAAAVLAAAVDHVATHGGGHVVCWVPGANDADDALLERGAFECARELYEMRVALPLAEVPRIPPGINIRAFTPGVDDDAFLTVNNRAFAGHEEQGGWTTSTLQRRMVEPWFDPQIFLCAFDDGGLAAFNWMKMQDDGADGEIYVIGVDPRMQGTGLGRGLAIAGLEAVHERGATTGSLFVAADNAAALALYRSLGFTVRRTDRAYVREVDPV